MVLTLVRDSGISSLPDDSYNGKQCGITYQSLGHFCDTSDGAAELQKRPDQALARKLGVRECDCCPNESALHITLIYYEI